MAATAELLRSPEPYASTERFVDNYRPCESVDSIESMDLNGHVDAGRTVIMLDAEGTFVWQNGWIVDEPVKQKLDATREYAASKGKNLHVFIVTNKKPKTNDDFIQMQGWAEQVDAEQLFTPLARGQGKPSPYMLLQVMEYMEKYHPDEQLSRENYLMIDDKLTAGIAAANFIGIYSAHVERRGYTDLTGDHLRRVIESALLKRYGVKGSPSTPTPSEARFAEIYKPATTTQNITFELPEGHAGKILINGYSRAEETIELSEERLGQLRPGPLAAIVDPITKGYRALDSLLFDNDFMREHGDVMGDLMTEIRPIIMELAASAIEEGDKKTAFACYIVAWITDYLDGKMVRASNRGPSAEGAKKDYTNDKRSADRIAEAMVATGMMPAWTHHLIKMREALRNQQRARAEQEGHDTKATRGGKASTAVEALVGGYAILESNKTNRDLAFMIMVVSKYASLVTGMSEWRILTLQKQFAEEMRRNARENGNLQNPHISITLPERMRRTTLPKRALAGAGIRR